MQPIIQHLFRVDSLEEVPRERLEELVATYPSFGMGRYLLSRKLYTEDAGHFSEETQKTNLYFSNPFWLHWLLQNEVAVQKPAYSRLEPSSNPVEEVSPNLVAELSPGLIAEPSPNLIAEETMIEDEQSWGIPDESPVAEQVSFENEFPIIQDSAAAGETGITGDFFQESLPDTETAPSQETTASAADSLVKPVLADEPGVTEELNAPQPSVADALLQSLEEARNLRQALVQMNGNEVEGAFHSDQTATVEQARVEEIITPVDEVTTPVEQAIAPMEEQEQVSIVGNSISSLEQTLAPAETGSEEDNAGGVVGIAESRAEEALTEQPADKELEEPEVSQTAHLSEVPQTVNALQERQTAQTLESSVEAAVSAAAVTAQAAAPAEQIVVFEPYHTIDYFASVGIKLILEENPSDKLGKQLKSFTDWLKVMRKLPQKNQEIVPDVAVEHQIQAIAAHSITGKDVLTETMAEVLVKQGMREKAVDVYHKLSLLNPEKSAYFATKIEQLKID